MLQFLFVHFSVVPWSLSHVLEPHLDRVCVNAKRRAYLPHSSPPNLTLGGLLSPVEFALFCSPWLWKSNLIWSQVHIGLWPSKTPFYFPTRPPFPQKENVSPKAVRELQCSLSWSSIPLIRVLEWSAVLVTDLALGLNTATYNLANAISQQICKTHLQHYFRFNLIFCI